MVWELNERFLLFGNNSNKDYALYSTKERKIIKYLRDVIEKTSDYIITETDNTLTILYLNDLDVVCQKYDKIYKYYEKYRLLAYLNGQNEYNLLYLDTHINVVCSFEGQFVSFLSTPYIVFNNPKSYYSLIVRSLLDANNLGMYNISSIPVYYCCGTSFMGDVNDKLQYYLLFKEKNENIRKIVNVEQIFIVKEKVIMLKKYYEYNSRDGKCGWLSSGNYVIEDDKNNIIVQFSSGEYPSFIQTENGILITTTKRLVYYDIDVLFQISNAQLLSSSDEIFYSKEENGKYYLSKLYDIKMNVSVDQISKEYVSYGVVKIGDEYLDFAKNKRLEFSSTKIVDDSLILYNEESTISYLYLDHILYRINEKCHNIHSVSKKGNTLVIKDGDQFRIGMINRKFNQYDIEPLVISDFDLSKYSSPLFTDTKENILCRKENKYIFYNITNGLEQDFEINNFVIKGVNGYRPIIQMDAYRRPVLIDPITLQVAPSEILSSDYSFISPSGRYRVDYKRLFKNKHTNQIVTEIECYEWMKEYSLDRLSLEDKEAREIVANKRRSYLLTHPDFFERYQNEQDEKRKEEALNCILRFMKDIEWMHHCFNELVIIHDSKSSHDIKIEVVGMFWFKNYIAFSYDDKYVAIAARYPNGTFVGGYFALYDLEQQTSIVSMTNYDNKYTLDAVWVSAFTKKSNVAFYTSEPHTFIVEPASGNVKRIEGTSFLCYSPDGKYMALSNQGYIQYEKRRVYGTWGHQKSSTVYIYEVETLSCVKTLSCFFGEKISGVKERMGSVASVAFSQDNSQLLISSDDGVVVIYNLETISK